MMVKLNNFCESVFYKSNGLEELFLLRESLQNLILFHKHLQERTIQNEYETLTALIEDAFVKAKQVFKTNVNFKIKQDRFDALEHLVLDIILKLNDIVSWDDSNNNQYKNVVRLSEQAVTNFLNTVRNDYQASGITLSHCFTNNNLEYPVNVSHFNIDFYRNNYPGFAKNKDFLKKLKTKSA